jgi:hypothetical protein
MPQPANPSAKIATTQVACFSSPLSLNSRQLQIANTNPIGTSAGSGRPVIPTSAM